MSINLGAQGAINEIRELATTLKELKSVVTGLSKNVSSLQGSLNGVGGVSADLDQKFKNLSKSQKSAFTQVRNLKKVNEELSEAYKKQALALAKLQQQNKSSISSFSKLGASFISLASALGLVGATQIFANILKSTFKLVTDLNAMAFSMKAVITDTYELGKTQVWLSDITNRFGAELVTTTNRYIKFKAAAQQAGFTARETRDIFGSMTKAAGVLGLKTDELRGIYLALEQMISKGKITTEELRRQLGERLPGAMDIMATSMGVSTAELDKMMKKGEVLTKDVLPAFAKQVEIAFGIENVDRVDTLAAATARLSNSWTELIQTVEGSGGLISGVFIYIIETATDLITTYKDLTIVIKEVTKTLSSNRLVRAWKYVRENNLSVIKTIKQTINSYADLIGKVEEHRLAVEEAIRLADTQVNGFLTLNEALFRHQTFQAMTTEELQDYIDKMKEVIAVQEDGTKYLEGTVGWYREQIKLQKALIEFEGRRANIIPIQEKINNLQEKLNNLLGIELKTKNNLKEKVDTGDIDLEILRKERLMEIEKNISDDKDRNMEDRILASSRYYELDLELLKLNYDKKIKLAQGNESEIALIEQKYKFDVSRSGEDSLYDLQQKAKEDNIKAIVDLENEKNTRLISLRTEYKNDAKKLKEEEEKLNFEINKRIAKAEIDYLKEKIKIFEDLGLPITELKNKVLALEAVLAGMNFGDSTEELKLSFEEILDLASQFNQAIGDLVDAGFERRIENINAEIDAETKKYDKLLELEANNKNNTEALEKQKAVAIALLEKKRLKEEQKQAKARKAAALVDIAINTAIGISASTKTGPLGLWAIPIIAALGALQIATVLAQPIPQYKDGLDEAKKDHIAMINDGSSQEYVERGGKILTTKTKNAIVGLKKGDTVHKDYDSMVKNSILLSAISNGSMLSQNNFEGLDSIIEKGLINGFKKAKINNNLKLVNNLGNSYKESLSRWN